MIAWVKQMSIFRKESNEGIYPLSCDPKLNSNGTRGLAAYYRDLQLAFRNPRIHNIAITGQHGVGKSSLIKSFDASRRPVFGRKPKFLYVSLGQYVKPKVEKQLPSQQGGDGKQTQLDEHEKEQNAIERRILLQLCAKFEDYLFPSSGFRFIPRQPGTGRTFLFVLFAMSVLLLMMKGPIAELFLGWKPQETWMAEVLAAVLQWHEYLEMGLYAVVLAGAALIFAKGFKWLCIRGKGSQFSMKTNNMEWSLGEAKCDDYLDQYTQELIYCLSRVRRKIDYTVVFEDMDRLDMSICIPIFTRLREINHILNANMKSGEHIRFLFAIRDDVANALTYDKFFDFTLPVIPTLNEKSAEAIFREKLTEVNRDLEKEIKRVYLRPRVGRVGTWLILFLDRHPILKELCWVIRWLIGKVIGAVAWLLKKLSVRALWEKAVQKWPALNKVTDWFLLVGKWFARGGKKLSEVHQALCRCPVLGHFICWINKVCACIRDCVIRVWHLLSYREAHRDCANCDYNAPKCSGCIRRMEDMEDNGSLKLIAAALTDYRKMHTVLNEYSLSVRQYLHNSEQMSCLVGWALLTYQLYKHLWPEDYHDLLEGKQSVLTGKPVEEVGGGNDELLKELAGAGMLCIDNLHYAGYSVGKIREVWDLRLKQGKLKDVLLDMDPSDREHQLIVRQHCAVREAGKEQFSDDELLAALRFLSDSPWWEGHDWFFKDRDSEICLRVLAQLEDDVRWSIIVESRRSGEENVLKKCYPVGGRRIKYGKWTTKVAMVYAECVPAREREAQSVNVSDGTGNVVFQS